jgi:hypothetical protein
MAFEAELLSSLVDALYHSRTPEKGVLVIFGLFYFLTVLAIFLESGSMYGATELASWEACWIFDASAIIIDEGEVVKNELVD